MNPYETIEDRGLMTICEINTQDGGIGELDEKAPARGNEELDITASASGSERVDRQRGGVRDASLTAEQQACLEQVLKRYENVFSESPGKIKGFECQLHLKSNEGYYERNYPIPYAHRIAVDKQIEKMLNEGIIEPATSQYINPMVVVIKKGGSVRLCLDARQLNKKLIAEYECPSPPHEILQSFGDFCWLTTIDMVASFWQVSLEKNSRKYTAFKHKLNVYQFVRLPFGLCTSVSTFVRAMNKVLGMDIEHFCKIYVDDLLIYSRSFEEHMKHIDIVLGKLERGGVTANIEKSKFCQKSVDFLGHLLSVEGLSPNPKKIESIHAWPKPKNQKQLKGFLGLCSFFRIYSCEYAEATAPLQELLKKDSKWGWKEKHQTAFDKVKNIFSEKVQLKFPDYNSPFYMQCDASDYGLGAYLYQFDEEGFERVISMGSRLMPENELNFTITEK